MKVCSGLPFGVLSSLHLGSGSVCFRSYLRRVAPGLPGTCLLLSVLTCGVRNGVSVVCVVLRLVLS